MLPKKFAIVIDAWSNHDTHLLALFDTFSRSEVDENKNNPSSKIILDISSLMDEKYLTAPSYYETIGYLLSV